MDGANGRAAHKVLGNRFAIPTAPTAQTDNLSTDLNGPEDLQILCPPLGVAGFQTFFTGRVWTFGDTLTAVGKMLREVIALQNEGADAAPSNCTRPAQLIDGLLPPSPHSRSKGSATTTRSDPQGLSGRRSRPPSVFLPSVPRERGAKVDNKLEHARSLLHPEERTDKALR